MECVDSMQGIEMEGIEMEKMRWRRSNLGVDKLDALMPLVLTLQLFAPPPTAPPFLCSHRGNGRGDSEDLQEAHVLHQHHVLHQDGLHEATDDAPPDDAAPQAQHLSNPPPPPMPHATHALPQQHDTSNCAQHTKHTAHHSSNSVQHTTHPPAPNTTHPPPLFAAPICHKKRANPASDKALHPRGHLPMSSGQEMQEDNTKQMQEDDTKTIPTATAPTATAPLASDFPHHFQASGGGRGTVGVFWHCGWLGCVNAPAGYGHASAVNAVHGFASRYGHVDAVRELHPWNSSHDDAVGDKESVTISRAGSETSESDKTSEADMATQMVEEILTWLWDHSSRQYPHDSSRQYPHDSSRLSSDAAHGCGGDADAGHTGESDAGCSRSLRLAAGRAVAGECAGGEEAPSCAHTGNGSMTVTVAPTCSTTIPSSSIPSTTLVLLTNHQVR